MSTIDRTGADALISVEESNEIIKEVALASDALALCSTTPMSSKKKRIKVESTLPMAYWVDGEVTDADEDQGWKQSTKMEWDDKYLEAEEVAVIVPIPEAVLDDADYDIWGEVRPKLVQAMAQRIDAAVFFGTNKPTSWPAGLVPAAIAAGNTFQRGSVSSQPVDEDISAVMQLVEDDGYMPSGFYSSLKMKAAFRTLKDSTGSPVYLSSIRSDGKVDELYGEALRFSRNGTWNAAVADLFTGDFRKSIIGLRQDITTKVLTEAVIQDPSTGAIVYNLAQQDMVALRMTMRLGFQYVNPVTTLNSNAATRFPFAVLAPAA